jgi:hypothetical protein
MGPIQLLDHHGASAAGETHYAAGEAKPSWFWKQFRIAGTVRAFMCADCGLIRLYGDPEAA